MLFENSKKKFKDEGNSKVDKLSLTPTVHALND